MSERKEAFMRIVVGIISGIILALWKMLIIALTIVHFIYAVFSNKRNKEIAEFCNLWPTQQYRFVRYMVFATNTRPFPFTELGNVKDKIEFKR